ncbi:MAG: redoxin domain-containing protein [Fimbriimonadaceae bacterium]|nr:redoxin domain-containing protein [Fimbriimonadaceae bacterium]
MNRTLVGFAAALGVVCVGLVGCAEAPPPEPRAANPVEAAKPRHPVTNEMWQDAEKAAGQPAPVFEAKDANGATHSLATLTGGKPLALYFIKDGCPCSVDVEPLYQRMAAKFGDKVRFAGVINGDAEIAKAWLAKMETPYPVLLDPDIKVVKEYKADRSVYLLVIGPDGNIVRMWPGYSQTMLSELNATLAKMTGTEETPFDAAYAPREPTSGCSFYSDDPTV